MLADMAINLELARLVTYKAAADVDNKVLVFKVSCILIKGNEKKMLCNRMYLKQRKAQNPNLRPRTQ